MLVRADGCRGLGRQTYEAWSHLKPAKTLVVMVGGLTPYPETPEAFTSDWGETVTASWINGTLPDKALDWLLSGVDAVWTAETPYDFRLFDKARSRNVRTLLTYNFEFFGWLEQPSLPRPDVFLSPSRWHMECVPEAVYLPTPVDTSRFVWKQRSEAKTLVHVGGHPTRLDRDGSRVAMECIRYLDGEFNIVIRSQQEMAGIGGPLPKGVSVRLEHNTVERPEALWSDADVVLLPRRFGGQSLKLNEALACGSVVLMPSVAPQDEVLPDAMLVHPKTWVDVRLQPGVVRAWQVDPKDLAERCNDLARNPDLVADLSCWSRDWAERHSWEALLPEWQSVLAGDPVATS